MSITRTLALSFSCWLALASADGAHAQQAKHKPSAPKQKAGVHAGASGGFELGGGADAQKPAEAETAPASSLKEEPAPGVNPATAGAAAAPSGAAAPQAPAPASASNEPASEANDTSELASVRQDLAQVMDDLVQARARVAVLGKALFKTRVRLKIDNRAAPDQVAVRATLWLDGAPIFNGDAAAIKSPERVLFDGFAAPGSHVLTVEIEQRARADEAYRYTLRNSYRFLVVREKRTDLVLVLDDDSDIAEDFGDDQEGEYDVRTRLKVRAVGLNEE